MFPWPDLVNFQHRLGHQITIAIAGETSIAERQAPDHHHDEQLACEGEGNGLAAPSLADGPPAIP